MSKGAPVTSGRKSKKHYLFFSLVSTSKKHKKQKWLDLYLFEQSHCDHCVLKGLWWDENVKIHNRTEPHLKMYFPFFLNKSSTSFGSSAKRGSRSPMWKFPRDKALFGGSFYRLPFIHPSSSFVFPSIFLFIHSSSTHPSINYLATHLLLLFWCRPHFFCGVVKPPVSSLFWKHTDLEGIALCPQETP